MYCEIYFPLTTSSSQISSNIQTCITISIQCSKLAPSGDMNNEHNRNRNLQNKLLKQNHSYCFPLDKIARAICFCCFPFPLLRYSQMVKIIRSKEHKGHINKRKVFINEFSGFFSRFPASTFCPKLLLKTKIMLKTYHYTVHLFCLL